MRRFETVPTEGCDNTQPFAPHWDLESRYDEHREATVGCCARADCYTLHPIREVPQAPTGPQNVLRKLPTDAQERKGLPIGTGVVDYFPLALAEIAKLSKAGNDQHNPGQPLHWARGKSNDHWDCIVRHGVQRGSFDSDGQRHSAKLAWRALALLQTELEEAAGWTPAEEDAA